MSTLRTAAQDSQYTVDYVYSVNSISIVLGPRSFRPYPKFIFYGEWVVYVETVTYNYFILFVMYRNIFYNTFLL